MCSPPWGNTEKPAFLGGPQGGDRPGSQPALPRSLLSVHFTPEAAVAGGAPASGLASFKVPWLVPRGLSGSWDH